MEVNETDLLALYKAFDVLKPYLGLIVLVGGWVPVIYRKYGNIGSRHPSVRTTDIDIAIPRRIPYTGLPTVDSLLIGAGYEVEIVGSYGGAVKYKLTTPPSEIEFITPEIGRPGQPSIPVQSGLQAQALRYVEILLDNTRQITVRESTKAIKISAVVKVPSPAAFIFQKSLTLPDRRDKLDKDLYYIFDLVDSTPKMIDEVIKEMKAIQREYAKNWAHRTISNLERYFPESGGQGPVLVGNQYTGEMPIETFRNYVLRVFRNLIAGLKQG
jgi:hypothetical protein